MFLKSRNKADEAGGLKGSCSWVGQMERGWTNKCLPVIGRVTSVV